MRFLLIDYIIQVKEYLLFFIKVLSIYLVANFDILHQSYKPIKLQTSSRSQVKYLIIADNDQNQRRLSWFYNWYDTITMDDWIEYNEIFSTTMPPKHKLLFIGSEQHHTLVEVSLDPNSNTVLITNENNNKILPSTIGCMNPKMIYQNSLK